VLSNGFAFRLCNLHNLAFRGLDLAYMPSPPGFANRDRPTPARLGLRSVHPRDSSTHEHRQVLPRSFAAEDQDGARFRTDEVQDGARFMTGEDQTTRREDLDGATTAARNAAIRRRATREELQVTENRMPREKPSGKKV
jgi:hypothetical protein